MTDLIFSFADLMCSLPMWKQILFSIPLVIACAGLMYLAIWGTKVLFARLAEGIGVTLDADFEAFEDWMDYDSWEAR